MENALFDQGLVEVMQVAATHLMPDQKYFLALSQHPDGSGPLESLATFAANPAGGAIVDAVGPLRKVLQPGGPDAIRYLVVVSGTPAEPGSPVQIQSAVDARKGK